VHGLAVDDVGGRRVLAEHAVGRACGEGIVEIGAAGDVCDFIGVSKRGQA
jgi:hypothetical protein